MWYFFYFFIMTFPLFCTSLVYRNVCLSLRSTRNISLASTNHCVRTLLTLLRPATILSHTEVDHYQKPFSHSFHFSRISFSWVFFFKYHSLQVSFTCINGISIMDSSFSFMFSLITFNFLHPTTRFILPKSSSPFESVP